MRRNLWIFVTATLLAASPATFDADRYLSHIKYLASPELRGRATGSPELEQAARYIASQFRADGLEPVMQPFQVTSAATLGRSNRFDYTIKGKRHKLSAGKEYIPVSFSSSGYAAGPVVFAGYGLTSSAYDDYAGLDVQGKIVLVLAHTPQEREKTAAYSKAANARSHGARAVLLVRDGIHHKADPEALDAFGHTMGPADAGIPFVELQENVARAWFDLDAAEKKIDDTLKPNSFVIESLAIRENIDVRRAVKTVHNVTAYWPGETSEYVIIGAHYDHLGLGEQFSLAPSLAGTVHPGADDNASGTAGVLELARHFAAGPKLRRGMLFVTFAGEEMGLLGSSWYANHPLHPLKDAVTMINLDMIGRARDGKIYIGAAGTGSTLRATLDGITSHFPNLKPDYSEVSGYGSSDHTSFTTKQVPVLFFFSGLHGDYHKPSDTWDKIDATGTVPVLDLIAETAANLASAPNRPTFVRLQETKAPGGSGSGYGPYFGSIPDFAEPRKGVRFADVRDGSPAALAGLKAGDILIRMGDKDIANLYDFTDALRSHKAGETVQVDVLRGDAKISASVKLVERK